MSRAGQNRIIAIGDKEYTVSQGRVWVRYPKAEHPEWMQSAHNSATIGTILEEMTEGSWRPLIELVLNPVEGPDPLEELLEESVKEREFLGGWPCH